MSDVEITVAVPEWLADSLALVAKICEKSIDQVASVLFARSASAPRERQKVYHKSQRLWVKKSRLGALPCQVLVMDQAYYAHAWSARAS